jgi:predicted nucleotidyltransferase
MAGADAALIEAATQALLPIETVRLAYLFGSRARGTARSDSDLDIAVAYASSTDPAQRERLRRQIVTALTDALGTVGERTDVVDLEFAPAEIAFAAIRATRLLARSEVERVRLEARIARRYDDEAPRREIFRAAARRVAEEMGRRTDGRP